VKLDPEAALLDGLAPRQVMSLRSYAELLENRGVSGGLVARGDSGRIWPRHVLDSLRALPCLRPSDRRVIDVGSGAGLPGIPLAVAVPRLSVVLLEARTRRVAFLELASSRLDLPNVTIEHGRAESTAVRAQVCLARALAPLPAAWELCAPLLEPGGRLVYFAGRRFVERDVGGIREAGVRAEICAGSLFPGYGPLVIMQLDS